MKSLSIVGRRWFRRTYGNTYHTATITVDGKIVCTTSMQYGYGDQYVQTAFDWLEANGYLSACPRHKSANGSSEAPWQWAERAGVEYSYYAVDVARQRDL